MGQKIKIAKMAVFFFGSFWTCLRPHLAWSLAAGVQPPCPPWRATSSSEGDARRRGQPPLPRACEGTLYRVLSWGVPTLGGVVQGMCWAVVHPVLSWHCCPPSRAVAHMCTPWRAPPGHVPWRKASSASPLQLIFMSGPVPHHPEVVCHGRQPGGHPQRRAAVSIVGRDGGQQCQHKAVMWMWGQC